MKALHVFLWVVIGLPWWNPPAYADCTDQGSDGLADGVIVIAHEGAGGCIADGVDDQVEIQEAVNNGAGTTILIRGSASPYSISAEIQVNVDDIAIVGDPDTVLTMTAPMIAFRTTESGRRGMRFSQFRLTGDQDERGTSWFGWSPAEDGFAGASDYTVELMDNASPARLFSGGANHTNGDFYGYNLTIRNNRNNTRTTIMFMQQIVFSGNQGYGLLDMNRNIYDVLVENNVLIGGSANYMIRMHGGSRWVLRNNILENNQGNSNGSEGNTATLGIDGGKEVLVIGNDISARSDCIKFTSTINETYTFTNNRIHGCLSGVYTKIDPRYGAVPKATFTNNVIYATVEHGVYIADAAVFPFVFKNNVIAGGSGFGLRVATGTLAEFNYNDVWGNTQGDYSGDWSGTGNISVDPLFADATNADFHLKSQAGRWTEAGWVLDNETSPAIDAGDPADDFSKEPEPNGGRINLGAYGNTDQASKTPEGPDFGVSCNPATLTVPPGGSGKATCKVGSILGFAETVTMSCSGLAAGVVCEFNPKAVALPGGGSEESALAVLADGNANAGRYPFQTVGTAVGRSRLFPMTLVVERQEDGGEDGGDGGAGPDTGPDDPGPDGKDGSDGGDEDASKSDLGQPIAGSAGCGCGGAFGASGFGAVMIGFLLVVRRRLGDRP